MANIWPFVLSIASEVDKIRQGLLKQQYRKLLVRKNVDIPLSPIETSIVTSLLCEELLPIVCCPFRALLPVMNNKYDLSVLKSYRRTFMFVQVKWGYFNVTVFLKRKCAWVTSGLTSGGLQILSFKGFSCLFLHYLPLRLPPTAQTV